MKSIVNLVIYSAILATSIYFGIFNKTDTFDDVAKKNESSLFSANARNDDLSEDIPQLSQRAQNNHNARETLHLHFRSPERAAELFDNHKQEFSGKFGSVEAYVKGANETVMNADLAKVDAERGDMVFLDHETCYFAVVSKQYEFRTFIKPRDCDGYFEHQQGVLADPDDLRKSFPKWAFAEKYAGGRATNGPREEASNSSNDPFHIPNYEFTSEASAKSHYQKHGREFGGAYSNWVEYVRGANSAIARSTREKTRSNGDKLYLVDKSCEFVVLASFGKIRTYFRPNDCIRYFQRQ